MIIRHEWEDYREQVKRSAQGNWPPILQALGVAADSLLNRHGPCPGCGGKDRFRFDHRKDEGVWFCSQGQSGGTTGGDGFALLNHIHGWTFHEAIDAVADVLSIKRPDDLGYSPGPHLPPAQKTKPHDTDRRAKALKKALSQSQDWVVPTSVIGRYFASRGLAAVLADPPQRISLHPSLPYWHPGDAGTIKLGEFPAMLCQVTDAADRLVTVHRTYLTHSGSKADVPSPKKLMPPIEPGMSKGSAIRLYEATDRVAVAEGVETALAVRSARHIPVWSTVNALGMATLILPDSIKSVEIWADHDRNETGQDAARQLAQRLHRSGVQVRLFIPEAPGDWLDVLNAEEVAA